MNVVGTVYLTGCNYQVGYDLLSTNVVEGYHTIRTYGVLNVTNNYISWSSGSARVWDTTRAIGTYYSSGSYTLVSEDVKVYCDSSGHAQTNITGSLNTTFVSGSTSGTAYLPDIDKAAQIDSFSGTSLTDYFDATFTAKSGYNYKLRISVPGVAELQKFSNYTSGTNVKLNETAIQNAKQQAKNGIVKIGGVIETYKGSSKIGESSELVINCKAGSSARIRINGVWKEATPYIRVNGQWKEATPYIRVNNQWKEGI